MRKLFLATLTVSTCCVLLSGCQSAGTSPQQSTQTYELKNSGRIIAHENGYFNFDPMTLCHGINTCPAQLSAMEGYNDTMPLQKQIHFVKLSLRSLSDGTWVISHDSSQPVRIPLRDVSKFRDVSGVNCLIYQKSTPFVPVRGFRVCNVELSKITSRTFVQLQKYHLDVYRLDAYIRQDSNKQFSYMLYFKVAPNTNIIHSINKLRLNNRVVLEVGNNDQSAWIHNYQMSAGYKGGPVYYTGRVRNMDELNSLKQDAAANNYKNMWAVEVSGADLRNIPATRKIVQAINSTTLFGVRWKSEVDSMHYLPLNELRKSGCKIPLHALGASMTMTSRPKNCMKKVNNRYYWENLLQ
tara:strand:- start:42 stop:1100 length:1059 start_codon:yes stop_codon:yes gene_type:complete